MEKLLPDLEVSDPHLIKPVLVVDLDDLLIDLKYTPSEGWKCQKRPYVDEFINELSKYYEVVLFSDSSMMKTGGIAQKIDKRQACQKLFREHTKLRHNEVTKDLASLNRPINKIIILDFHPGAYHLQKENAIQIDEKWSGDTTDNTLKRMIPFFVTLAQYHKHTQADMRELLNRFKDQDRMKQSEKGIYVEDLKTMLERYETLLEQQRQSLIRQQQQQQQQSQQQQQTQTKQAPRKRLFGLL